MTTAAPRQEITAANGSRWTVTRTLERYGRTAPAGREYWAQRVEGVSPAGLAGVLGFYASSLDEARARLGA